MQWLCCDWVVFLLGLWASGASTELGDPCVHVMALFQYVQFAGIHAK
jgi:hypothetical protein